MNEPLSLRAQAVALLGEGVPQAEVARRLHVDDTTVRTWCRAAAGRSRVRVLTRRQLEVLRLAANGNTAAEIAGWLGVTADTINGTLRHAYRNLGVNDRAHAVAVACRVGLLRPGDIVLPEALRARLSPAAPAVAPSPQLAPPGPPQARTAPKETQP
ncbi:LuxR C-terminal-related transcriptional regulator [Streptomyces sp. NPDC006207]